MGVKVKEEFNYIPKIAKAIEYLGSHHLEIGIFGEDDSHILMIARVHEFGVVITPKKAQSLTIPLIKEAVGKSPSEFKDLFIPKGTNVLARKKGDGFEAVYALVKSVEIPERSFMRAGFDSNKKDFQKKGEHLIQQAIALEIAPKTALDVLGRYIADQIQVYLTKLREPPNSPVTISNKGSSNPLIGKDEHLRDSITYKIVSG
ncbi:MAG: hypothetical protein FH762_17385 [Firmicutes bacterium]|nr:hypothetical protein [Bacillota bacterium]